MSDVFNEDLHIAEDEEVMEAVSVASDHLATRLGNSSKQQRQTALNQFSKFLMHSGNTKTTFDDFSEEELGVRIQGDFCNYLLSEYLFFTYILYIKINLYFYRATVRHSTTQSYLSQLKAAISEKFHPNGFEANKRMRRNVTTAYHEHHRHGKC